MRMSRKARKRRLSGRVPFALTWFSGVDNAARRRISENEYTPCHPDRAKRVEGSCIERRVVPNTAKKESVSRYAPRKISPLGGLAALLGRNDRKRDPFAFAARLCLRRSAQGDIGGRSRCFPLCQPEERSAEFRPPCHPDRAQQNSPCHPERARRVKAPWQTAHFACRLARLARSACRSSSQKVLRYFLGALF